MGNKKYTFVLCDGNSKNSHGFRTNVDGISLERFRNNPVMLYGHDSYSLDSVIGKWENIRIEDGKLMADAVFDTDDEMGKRVAGKVERGFLKGCSMGLHVISMVDTDEETVAEKSEILEASVCPIPSDANAVRLYDENRKELTFEQVRLQFNNQLNNQEMDKNQEKNEAAQNVSAKDAEIANLKAQLAESKKREVDTFLSAAVQSGKISESEKANFAKLAEGDFDTVKAIVDAKQPKATTSLKDLQAQTAASTPAGRESWTYLKWMKEDSEGLKRLKAENPTEFERLKQHFA